MLSGMSTQIAVGLPEEALRRLDAAIARGVFANRAAAVRAGLDYLPREEREAEISAAYRRGYAADDDGDAVGKVGLELGSALLAGEHLAEGEPTA